jgi:hypothetical protein
MIDFIRKSPRLIVMSLIILSLAFGCKSKKKAREAAAEKARMEQEAARKEAEMERRMKEAEERARRDAELKANEETESEPDVNVKLDQYFEAISNSSNITSANKSINEALTLFASPETPVLIVISKSGDQKDYDRPTTIKDYLNYLKDQKQNINEISNLKMDASGKITEVELTKNF